MTHTVRCKMVCDEISQTMGGRYRDIQGEKKYVPEPVFSVKMSPVYHNNNREHENTKFWEATPSGSFEIQSVNREAVEHLQVGKEYYFDIVEAPETPTT